MLAPVDPAIFSSNSRFEALYRDLCTNKLNADGTSKLDAKAQTERDNLSKNLRHARIEAAKRSLIQSGLQDLSYRPDDLPEDLQELVAVVAALIEGTIGEDDKELLRDDLVKFKENLKPIAMALTTTYEDDARTLSSILDPDNPPDMENLPLSLQQTKESIASSKSAVAECRLDLAQEATKAHETYRQIIESSIRILEQTIHGSVARGTKAKADYLAVVAEGMSKKLSLQHAQLLSQLYSPEMQEALQRNSEELVQAQAATKRKIRDAEEKLGEYERAGGMDSMAREYAKIMVEVEKVKTDIARLEDGGE